MFERNWRNGIALGLTIGICASAFVAALNGWAKRLAQCVGDGTCQGYAKKYEDGEIPNWWWWRWTGDLVSSGDTLAQWIMAILTIVAVALLWLTLRRADETNKAAINAANAATEANEIMRQEQRPWVVFTREIGCKFQELDGRGASLEWRQRIDNVGKSPAFSVKYITKLVADGPVIGDQALRDFIFELHEEEDFARKFTTILPNEDFGFTRRFTAKADVIGPYYYLLAGVTYKLSNAKNAEAGVDIRVFHIVESPDILDDPDDTHILAEDTCKRQVQ